jgi:three-Cys-motif partner protein
LVKEGAYEWAERRAKNLFDNATDLEDDSDVKYTKGGLWSVKKLLAIEWYIEPFYRIASKHLPRWVYIDFFCGSGLMSVTSPEFSKSHAAVGSALLPLFLSNRYPFKDYYYFDVEREKINALNRRIAKIPLPPDVKVHVEPLPFEESCEKLFGEGGLIRKKALALVIIDPEGLDVKWRMLEKILKNGFVDVILTFMTYSVGLNHSNAMNDPAGSYAKTMTEFFGDWNWKTLKSDGLLPYYRKKIEGLGYRTYKVSVERTGQSVIYDLVFCTKNEKVGNIFRQLEEIMNEIRPRLLEGAIGRNQNEFKSMLDFTGGQ